MKVLSEITLKSIPGGRLTLIKTNLAFCDFPSHPIEVGPIKRIPFNINIRAIKRMFGTL